MMKSKNFKKCFTITSNHKFQAIGSLVVWIVLSYKYLIEFKDKKFMNKLILLLVNLLFVVKRKNARSIRKL